MRLRKRQRPQDHRIDDAENRRRRPNPERKGKDGRQRERRLTPEAANGIAKILQKRVHGMPLIKPRTRRRSVVFERNCPGSPGLVAKARPRVPVSPPSAVARRRAVATAKLARADGLVAAVARALRNFAAVLVEEAVHGFVEAVVQLAADVAGDGAEAAP